MKKIITILFLLLSSLTFASNLGGTKLAYDGVEFFISDEEERIGAYTLELKGIPYSYTYTVIKEGEEYFFPLFEFIRAVGVENYIYDR